PALRLIEQRGDAYRVRLALPQHLHQVRQSHAAIDDVLDDQYIRAFHRLVQIFSNLHFARAGLALSIAGDSHEFDEGVALDGPRQVREKNVRSFENTNQVQSTGWIIGVNLYA